MIDKLHLTITGRVLKATETLYSGESVIVEIEDSGLVPLNAADYRLILFGADKSILAASQPFAANAATWTATLDTATEAFQTYYENVNASVSKTLGMMIVNDNTGDTICAGTIGAVSVPFPMQLNTIPDLYADSFIQRTEAQSLLADAVAGLNAAKMAKVAAAVENNAAVFDSAGSVKDSGLKLVRRSVGNGSSIGIGNVSGVADYEKVVAIGDSGSAYGDNAVAVGMDSTVDGNGVAVGCNAHAAGQNTVAIGHRAIDEDEDNCVLIGANASINLGCGGGVAIGKDAHISADSESDHYADGAGNSVALGRNARIFGAANAVQLGEGTNTAPGSLQFRSFPVMDANGHIAPDAVTSSSIADGAVINSKLAAGVGNTAVSAKALAIGTGSFAGLKGYRWYKVAGGTLWFSGTGLADSGAWAVGDTISVSNGNKYFNCAEITGIDVASDNGGQNTRVSVDSLPFSSAVADNDFDAHAAWVMAKPEAGDIDIGMDAFAEGWNARAVGRANHAEGRDTEASGQYSHAEGRHTVARYAAHSEGRDTKALGEKSHAEGDTTTAGGVASHAEGVATYAGSPPQRPTAAQTTSADTGTGKYAHAEGNGTQASGVNSHAEGLHTLASGTNSHAQGEECEATKKDTTASGDHAAAEHTRSFVWSGTDPNYQAGQTNYDNGMYRSKGNGTFCINPAPVGQGETDPASGFFIGSVSLKARLDGKYDSLLPVEWADLVSLRNGGNLVPGRQYRIVDYAASTIQENTRVAEYDVDGETHVGHRFDLIVVADSPDRLNECARAIVHDGELPDDAIAEVDGETVRTGYFANSRLGAWRVWYCLDNDTARFGWADVQTGHGVIYRLIDEFGNDCPYDFKNIEFRRWKISAYTTADYTSEETAGNKYYLDNLVGVPLLPSASNMVLKKEYGSNAQPFLTLTNGGESEWRGTFSGNALSGQTFNVAIGGAGTRLPDNVFMQGEVHDIRLGTNNWGNTFQGKTFYLDFGPDCQYVMARGQCNYLRLGCGCGYVLLYCDANGVGNVGTVGNASGHILMIQTYGSSIGEYCAGIRLGVGSHGNTVGNQCADIVIGRRRLHDHNNEVCGGMAHVGIEGSHNWIGGMTAGSGTGGIEVDGSGNVFGVNCASVQFTGSYSSFGSDCRNIRASGAAANTGIVFGNGCHDISFGSVSDGGNGEEFIPDGNFRNVEFGPGVANVSLHCTGDTSSASYQNVSVLSGVHDKAIVDSNVGQEFHTVYQPADSIVHSV